MSEQPLIWNHEMLEKEVAKDAKNPYFGTEQQEHRSAHLFSGQSIKWVRNNIKFTSYCNMLNDFKQSHTLKVNFTCWVYREQLC